MKTVSGKKKKMNMNIIFIFILPVFLWLCFVSCDRKSPGINSVEGFMRIYDKPDTTSYTAIDIKEVMDGYTILGTVDNSPYLMKVDKQGNFLTDTGKEVFIGYTNPLNLIILNQEYYFFCNKPSIHQIPIALLKLVEINNNPEEVVLHDNLLFENVIVAPLHASKPSDNTIFLMAFDEDRKWNFVIKINSKGQGIWRRDFGLNDVCYSQYVGIVDKRQHFTGIVTNGENNFYYTHTYSRRAFFNEYFTCFWINILDPDIGKPPLPYELSLIPVPKPLISLDWDGVDLSGAFIDNNVISLIVNSDINNLEKGQRQSELIPSKAVFTRRMRLNNKEIAFFVGSSKNNKIVLYCYNRATETRLNKKYFGHTHIYEASGLITTDEGGLAILGTTFVAAHLGRICLFKLSREELEEMIID
jgi:hypothetical protein